MHGVDQLAELLHRSCALVEIRQRRIDIKIIQCGEGTSVTPHFSVDDRSRVHREQLQDPAVQSVENMIEFGDHIPESSAAGDECVAVFRQEFFTFRRRCRNCFIHIAAELPDKCGVDAVAADRCRIFNFDEKISAFRPDYRRTVVGNEAALAFKNPDFGQTERDFRCVAGAFELDIPPIQSGGRHFIFGLRDYFLSLYRAPAEVGAQHCSAANSGGDVTKGKNNFFTGKKNPAVRKYKLLHLILPEDNFIVVLNIISEVK